MRTYWPFIRWYSHFPVRDPGPHCDPLSQALKITESEISPEKIRGLIATQTFCINTKLQYDISPEEIRGLIATEHVSGFQQRISNFPGGDPGPHCDLALFCHCQSHLKISPEEIRGLIATLVL